MIRYSLRCDRDHTFESWFRDSQGFDDQNGAGLIACPDCGSHTIAKNLMAPSVVTSRRKGGSVPAAPPPGPPPAQAQAPVALLDDKARQLRALLREMRDHVMRTSDDVGARFPDLARQMHDGKIEHRSIRGEASSDDVRSLLEDGVEIMPVPHLPDERN